MPDNADASRRLAAEYSAKADAYARCWAGVIHPMARVLLDALPLGTARSILDLGCGTGDLLADLRSAAPRASLTGADRAEGMLRIARRNHSCGLLVTDATSLAMAAESFDLAILAFVLFHIPDPAAALREVRRVLRPDATLGIVAWGTDPGTPGAAFWTEELDACGAGPDPRDAIVMGHARMNTPERLAGLLREADFVTPRIWTKEFAHSWTVDDLFTLHATCGMPSRRLATLQAAAQTSCSERVRSRMAALTAEELVYRPEVLFAVARRDHLR